MDPHVAIGGRWIYEVDELNLMVTGNTHKSQRSMNVWNTCVISIALWSGVYLVQPL